MSAVSRRQVLKAFKSLHRARQEIFQGHAEALSAARKEINDRFKSNKTATDPEKINEMVTLANDVAHELRTSIVQAVETKPGVYKIRITEDMVTADDNIDLSKIPTGTCNKM